MPACHETQNLKFLKSFSGHLDGQQGFDTGVVLMPPTRVSTPEEKPTGEFRPQATLGDEDDAKWGD